MPCSARPSLGKPVRESRKNEDTRVSFNELFEMMGFGNIRSLYMVVTRRSVSILRSI